MEQMWMMGANAAEGLTLEPVHTLMPFNPLESDIFYKLTGTKPVQTRYTLFPPYLGASTFGSESDDILLGIERLLKGAKEEDAASLGQRTQIEYLQHSKEVIDEKDPESNLLLGYQAFTFEYYYKLLRTLVSFELTSEGAYFRGLWGPEGRELLFRCTQFGQALRNETASRAQVLYLLSTMYDARQKRFSEGVPKGLVGILGSVSVLARPLLRTTDSPSEICTFMVVDLPIFDLMADADGELYSGIGGGHEFGDAFSRPLRLTSKPPGKQWSIHARMGALFDEENGPGRVVMVARCDLRPVAWFSPQAADYVFLSSAYQPANTDVTDEEITDAGDYGFEVTDADWQSGVIPRAMQEDGGHAVGLICSRGCPALRYAAAGILFESGQEISIATQDLEVAYSRIQKPGMLIC